MIQYVKSPLHYTGNKYRILPQIQKFFPSEINIMVDLFCGGATVGLNTKCEKIIFIDNNVRVISLLRYLSQVPYSEILKNIIYVVDKYGLSFSAINTYSYYKNQLNEPNSNNGLKSYNSKGYYKLRTDYNNLKDKDTNEANLMLYILMAYSFNNDIRFSKDGNFNLPVGKTDINKSNLLKLKDFINRTSQISCEFVCSDFKSDVVKLFIEKADFIYMDPPYLITTAVYNETNKWNEITELDLLNLLDYLLDKNKNFVLSNILEKQNSHNEPLCSWVKKNKEKLNIIDIDYNYRSASYNKKNRDANEREIILKPKG